MAYKTLNSLDADVTITIGGVDKKTGKKNPPSVEGFYLGNRTVETKNRFSDKPSTLYFFQTETGNVGVWGKTDLIKKMSAAKPGDMTLITYTGMKPTPRGDMHTYRVEQDPSVYIDVSNLGSEVKESAPYEDETDEYALESAEDEESEELDETPAPMVARESAEARKAKVQELLKRGKNK